jgi:hypothetical protein
MTSGKKIAVLTCYQGTLPWYFDYFVHSCFYNPSIDFFIITDNTRYDKPVPPNLKFVFKELSDISAIATRKFGFPVDIKYGYKLCDFKPAYGALFSDILQGYDFWCHADIDVIFGNIRKFITDDMMDNFDLISVRPDWIPGCFLLFRNNDKMNYLFTRSKDFKKVFSSDQHFCFDETNFAHDDFTDGKTYQEVGTEIESMMHVVKKAEAENHIKTYFDLFIIEGIPGKLKFDKGVLTYRGKYEILLYHLIRLKKRYNPQRPANIPVAFAISPTKIYHI